MNAQPLVIRQVEPILRHPTDAQLLELLACGGPSAAAALHDRFARDVNRVVRSLLGVDAEFDDVVHEVFVAILSNVRKVRSAESLKGWVMIVAVNTVRTELRKRKLLRFFRPSESLPEPSVPSLDEQGSLTLRRVYALLDQLSVDERLAFVLRHVEDLALSEIAARVSCSLATVKRRLVRADQKFTALAARDHVIAEWMAAHQRKRGSL